MWVSVMALSGCAQQGKVLPLDAHDALALYKEQSHRFGHPIAVPDVADLYQLTSQQERQFRQFYQRRKSQGHTSENILFQFLSGELHRFSYRSQTSVAADTLVSLEGNCLSLAILTHALAKLTPAHVQFELVNSTPIFNLEKDIIERGVHVRTKVYRPETEIENALVNSRPGIIIDYFASRSSRFIGNLSPSEFSAMFYNNIAAELLAANKISEAFWYSRKALELAPLYAPHINTLAVIHRRSGDEAQAEKIYRYALKLPTDQLVILKNYRGLLQLQGRLQEAIELDRQIAQVDDPNPFIWIDLGDQALEQSRYQSALKYYQRAVDMAPYVHQSYFGLAKVWYQLGNKKKVRALLSAALEASYDPHHDARYEAKLQVLSDY